jgi:hypothetical protein
MRIVYKKTALLFLLIPLSAQVFAQTAAGLEALLNEPALTWSATAAFVLEAADSLNPTGALDTAAISNEDAFLFAAEREWLPKNAAPDDAARLNGVALLLMRSFDLKGGIFYSLFKGPHHAYRELVYKGLIRGDADPEMTVSGRQLLLIVSRILSVKEENEEGENE